MFSREKSECSLVSLVPYVPSASSLPAFPPRVTRSNAQPIQSAEADVTTFPGIRHWQENVDAEQQIRCRLTSVASHAVITGSFFCTDKRVAA